MKHRKSILTMMLFFSILLFSPAFAADATAPVASADQPVYRFSQVVAGTEIIHPFTIRNTGTAELKIISIYSA
ncbi:MAG: DUF1573 domain-containing protein [Deltaproteobacteria bacterium]|nr:DUF1573 domain-containing protein [Deltaproteobacteria bacterium]